MAQPKPMPGAARAKRNSWTRGKGTGSYRGELKKGISRKKKYLNRKIRHNTDIAFHGNEYRKVYKTSNIASIVG